MKYKCPACGYQPDKAQAQIETKLLFNRLPEDIQESLKKIINEVSKYSYNNRIPGFKETGFLLAFLSIFPP